MTSLDEKKGVSSHCNVDLHHSEHCLNFFYFGRIVDQFIILK